MFNLHSCYVKELDSSWRMDRTVTTHDLLIFITSGKLIYWVDNEKIPLQQGDILYIPEGSLRSGAALEYHQRYATVFSSTGADQGLLPILDKKKSFKMKIQNSAYFKLRFSQLTHHWQMKGPYLDTTCYAILLEMLSMINSDLDHRELGTRKLKLVTDIKNYIHNHHQESIKLQDLSDYSGKTPNYISCLFKQVTGFTPIEYLHDVRISVAKDLMLSKSITVREIAEQTGFCDQAYFHRVFKKVTGYSPTDFLNEKYG
ncbi:helix-turn-helix domain-containing protein [Paenibacillus sp. FSL H7-0331]|uniref:helix-turn-helix domain-containing protein n=1 Tax=Paenibacillus sp. FSL H7-0331 TaxID=1920421 RepID=UPI00096BEF44|nr:helix-turn-helix domain-containing protein [Paenibacillus sp. FSL H7-0331]OMF15817.1 hypothetical protein BK127_15975 [Paenibacillus sp. FSL H7-0331]